MKLLLFCSLIDGLEDKQFEFSLQLFCIKILNNEKILYTFIFLILLLDNLFELCYNTFIIIIGRGKMVFEKIQELLAEQMNIDKAKITRKSHIINDIKADSLDVVEMLIALEDEFEISVPDEDAKDLFVIGDLADYVQQKIDKK